MQFRVLTALPVYNEESHLLEVLEQVREYSTDILVVDDGSKDRTPILLQNAKEFRSFVTPETWDMVRDCEVLSTLHWNTNMTFW